MLTLTTLMYGWCKEFKNYDFHLNARKSEKMCAKYTQVGVSDYDQHLKHDHVTLNKIVINLTR